MHTSVYRKMPRQYTQTKRAEQQAETRQRIVEAAVELHGEVGPANTTVSMIAARAGVQRHTFYAHFPDERAMLMACSGHTVEHDPLPDAAQWAELPKGEARLKAGLAELYAWYERNEGVVGCSLRDAEVHELTREIVELRFGPPMAGYQDALGAGLKAGQRAMLGLALSFFTWRTLVREAGLDARKAAAAMAQAVMGA